MGIVKCIFCKKQVDPKLECTCGIHTKLDDLGNSIMDVLQELEEKENFIVKCPHCHKLITI